MRQLRAMADPFLLALLGTLLLATLLPPRGAAAPLFAGLADAGIVLLFFLHGAKLAREAIVAGAGNWRLHLLVLLTTFGLFPLIGLMVSHLAPLDPAVAAGLLFLTLLPSTVQSSIAFTAVAGGNVAAAVCSASFSNLLGIFITPALVAATMTGGGHVALSWGSVGAIAGQLLLPFLLGHALRPWIGGFVTRHKAMLSLVDRGSILLVVFTAFGAAVVEGLWHKLSVDALMLVALLCILILSVILLASWLTGRLFRLPREDAIVLLFCGSKKSLASGVPMAGVLFSNAQVGMVILPLMLFHQIQLLACTIIARHYAARPQRAAGLGADSAR